MQKLLVFGIPGVILVAAGYGACRGQLENTAKSEAVKVPSMIEVIVRPLEYEGASVEIFGFYGSRDPVLFLTRDHADFGGSDSSIRIVDTTNGLMSESCGGNYVLIEGTFTRDLPGSHPHNFHIDDVRRITAFERGGSPRICWPQE
jgi:hypothetical protein